MYITPSSKIYVDEATVLREKIIPYLEKGYKNFTFNFSSVTYIDSSGLAVLISIYKRADKTGGEVKIHGINGKVKQLFELTRLNKIFIID